MKKKITLTVICEKCQGLGWYTHKPYFYHREDKYGEDMVVHVRAKRGCRKCEGVGRHHEKRTFRYPLYNVKERVKRFREKNKARWNEIQKKYRHNEKYRSYMRQYLKKRRTAS